MIPDIVRIHGSSSEVIFDCEDIQIKASGEFFAEGGKIAGFAVSKPSLKYENGTFLTPEEREELICQYEKYANQPHIQKKWLLRFE